MSGSDSEASASLLSAGRNAASAAEPRGAVRHAAWLFPVPHTTQSQYCGRRSMLSLLSVGRNAASVAEFRGAMWHAAWLSPTIRYEKLFQRALESRHESA